MGSGKVDAESELDAETEERHAPPSLGVWRNVRPHACRNRNHRHDANERSEDRLAPSWVRERAVKRGRAAQAKTGRLLAVGFQELYVPAAHDIKARVLRGDIGTLRRVTVRAQWPRDDAYYARNNWAGRLRVNGASDLLTFHGS